MKLIDFFRLVEREARQQLDVVDFAFAWNMRATALTNLIYKFDPQALFRKVDLHITNDNGLSLFKDKYYIYAIKNLYFKQNDIYYKLKRDDNEDYYQNYVGSPSIYRIVNNKIELLPMPAYPFDLILEYYMKIPSLPAYFTTSSMEELDKIMGIEITSENYGVTPTVGTIPDMTIPDKYLMYFATLLASDLVEDTKYKSFLLQKLNIELMNIGTMSNQNTDVKFSLPYKGVIL